MVAFDKLVDGKQEKIYLIYFIHSVSCYVLSDNSLLLPSKRQQGILDFLPLLAEGRTGVLWHSSRSSTEKK